MQDLKKNKRRINQSTLQHEAKESLNEELQEDIARSCKSKGCKRTYCYDAGCLSRIYRCCEVSC